MADAANPETALSRGEMMLGSLIDEAHSLHPDDILPVVRRKGALVGLNDIAILVADWDHRDLISLEPDGERFAIDGSMAGRAFQRADAHLSEGEDEDGTMAWFPILDGTARIGVMTARLTAADALTIRRGGQLAGLVAYLLVAKRPYSDSIERATHTRRPTLAAQLRRSTLPPFAFEQAGVVSLGAMLQPAYEIAGDTFDYAVEREALHVAVFDAMGHGLAASQMATLALFAYRDARRQHLDLPDTYASIDEVVAGAYDGGAFVTANIGTLDLRTGVLRCVNAGHPRPLLMRARTSVQEIPATTHVPLGLGIDGAEASQVHLQPGDTIVYFSDGVTEARSKDGEQFGLERLTDLLVRSAAAELNAAETARRIAHAVVDHHDAQLNDDATILTFTWFGRPTE